jgi:two-component system, response regulator PdtaR
VLHPAVFVKAICLSPFQPSPLRRDSSFAPQPARPHAAFAANDASGAEPQPAGHGGILIVEDDFLIAAQLEATLREAGFEIAGVAVSGAEAIEYAVAQRPLLCVMDIRLTGDRDGIDTALELFRAHGIRCIFATAHYDNEARRRATAADPLGWLQKPYTMSSLVAMVRQAVNDMRGAH